ncbi:MAG: hypothetical protein GXO50_04970, partial [Chlorobi bacterium]|nr:hypothetical protein [Chlorobiota bacterium]
CKEFLLEEGEHFINAVSTDGKIKWDTTVNISKNMLTIKTGLQRNTIKTAPVLFVAKADCDLYIDGKKTATLEKDGGKKILLEYGKHKFKAVNGNKKWEKIITVKGKAQKVIKIEFKNGTFTDSRDGHTYKTVQTGKQVWMAENLAYDAGSGCWAYDNNSYNVSGYGYLYNWQTAKNVCPSGWHLPTKEEFETLLDNYGDDNENYKALIPGGVSGFSATFGGLRTKDNYNDIDNYGYFWSASADNNGFVWMLGVIRSDKESQMYYGAKDWGVSVRCIKD